MMTGTVLLFSLLLASPCASADKNAIWYVRPDGMSESECARTVNSSHKCAKWYTRPKDHNTECARMDDSSLVNCKSLLEYARDVDRYFTNDATIEFLSGPHNLSGLLQVNRVHNLSLKCRKGNVQCIITCEHGGGLVFKNSSDVHLSDIAIESCGANVLRSALSFMNVIHINIKSVNISRSEGFGLNVHSCSGRIKIKRSSFTNNTGSKHPGGNAKFKYSKCPTGHNVLVISSSSFTDGKSNDKYMSTKFFASGIQIISHCSDLKIELDQVKIDNNRGGNIYFFMKNSIGAKHWEVNITNCSITNGKAKHGAGLFFYIPKLDPPEYNKCSKHNRNILRVMNTKFMNNTVMTDGGGLSVRLHDSDCTPHKVEIIESLFCHNSVIRSSGHSSAIKIQKDTIPGFYKRTIPINEFYLKGTAFFNNTRLKSELSQGSVMEVLNIEKMEISDCNFTDNLGTALSLRLSNAIFSGEILFKNNTATNGGALKLCESSMIFINSSTTMIFNNNTASTTGGAIFSQQPCLDEPMACFFQPNIKTRSHVTSLESKYHIVLKFVNNSAKMAGDAVYGGHIENCYTYKEFIRGNGNYTYFASQEIFNTIFDIGSQDDDGSIVASDPYSVLFCEPGENLSVIPGKTFQISVVAKGQLNGSVPSAITTSTAEFYQNDSVSIYMDNPKAEPKTCSVFNLTLKVYDKILKFVVLRFGIQHISERITHDNYASSNLSIESCPWGFQLSLEGVCDCIDLIKEQGHDCNLEELTIIKKPEIISWIGCQVVTNGKLCIDKEFLTSRNCGRFEYCNYSVVKFKRETIDSQCAQGRTGVLCGECKRNLSLMLGTSRCKPCSNKYVGLIVVYLVAGILLIFILTAFNITVTKGTLYGLIFYANFIHANQVSLFPHFSNWNISRILIAWLNLDLGIEVCFYNGLDAYQKTWLQFGYICYICSLQVIVIILCRRSVFFTRIFGRNVTKVLSTLIVICFAKALQTISDVLEFTILHNASHPRYIIVMSVTGNIKYLSRKHIPLLITAIMLCILLLFFSLCLLFIKILTSLSSRRCCRWVTRLQPFFETFTGPCNQTHTFWPGLLFCTRAGLYLFYSFKLNYLYQNFQLIITGLMALGIIILSFLTPKGVYKKWSLNLLEFSYMFNLLFTCGFVFFIYIYKYNEVLIETVGHISVSIALISFVAFHFRNHFRKLTVKCRSGAFKVLCTKKKQKKELKNYVTHSEANVSVESQDGERDPLLPVL